MKRVSFVILRQRGIEYFLLPTIGVKVLEWWQDKRICLCFAWLCFGLSFWVWTVKGSDTE